MKHPQIQSEFRCDQCDYVDETKDKIEEHAVSHKATKLNCNQCDYSTEQKTELNEHSNKCIYIQFVAELFFYLVIISKYNFWVENGQIKSPLPLSDENLTGRFPSSKLGDLNLIQF